MRGVNDEAFFICAKVVFCEVFKNWPFGSVFGFSFKIINCPQVIEKSVVDVFFASKSVYYLTHVRLES